MSKIYKKYVEIIDRNKVYSISDSLNILKTGERLKFRETVELSFVLDSKRAKKGNKNQILKESILLPHTIDNKTLRIAAITDDKESAISSGATVAGNADLIESIKKEKNVKYDIVISNTDLFKLVKPLGKKLGTKGLMPSAYNNTLTDSVDNSIKEYRNNRINFKVDKTYNVHMKIGYIDMNIDDLINNYNFILNYIKSMRIDGIKTSISKAFISTTMSPSIRIL